MQHSVSGFAAGHPHVSARLLVVSVGARELYMGRWHQHWPG